MIYIQYKLDSADSWTICYTGLTKAEYVQFIWNNKAMGLYPNMIVEVLLDTVAK